MILDAMSLVTNPAGNPGSYYAIGAAIHHSVTTVSPDISQAEERAHIRAIDTYHKGLGYGGFGYHWAIFPSGNAYHCGDGRRAHVAKRNHELEGFCLIGDFSGASYGPGVKQLDGLREALMYQHWQGDEIKGHREWALPTDPTACPGVVVPRDWDDFLHPSPPYVTRIQQWFSDGSSWVLDVVPPK